MLIQQIKTYSVLGGGIYLSGLKAFVVENIPFDIKGFIYKSFSLTKLGKTWFLAGLDEERRRVCAYTNFRSQLQSQMCSKLFDTCYFCKIMRDPRASNALYSFEKKKGRWMIEIVPYGGFMLNKQWLPSWLLASSST